MKLRTISMVVVLAALSASCSSSGHSAKPAPPTTPSTATPATIAIPANLPIARVVAAPGQTIQGFGASGAWWPNDLAKFPAGVQQQVANMLFSANGIALSGYRYNIGGGGVGVNTPARAPHEVATDTAGLTFLRAANAAHVPILTGFVKKSYAPRFIASTAVSTLP